MKKLNVFSDDGTCDRIIRVHIFVFVFNQNIDLYV